MGLRGRSLLKKRVDMKKELSTVKDVIDAYEPSWVKMREVIDFFPGAFKMRECKEAGYYLDVNIAKLEGQLPVHSEGGLREVEYAASPYGILDPDSIMDAGVFHGWHGHEALIEKADGTMESVPYYMIRFKKDK